MPGGDLKAYELARSACGSCGCTYNLTKRLERGFSPLCIDEIRRIAASVRVDAMRFSVDFNISQEWRNENISYLDC